MRELIRCILIVSAFLGFGGCAPKGLPLQIDAGVLEKAGLQYYWKVQLGLVRGENLSQVMRLDENLYCLTDQNRLIAIDAGRGLVKWSTSVAGPGETVFSPTHANNVRLPEKVGGIKDILSSESIPESKAFDAVMINTLSHVLVFDRSNGKLYRKIQFGFAASTAGVSDGKVFYVASTKGWYYAIRLREAVQSWWRSAEDMISAPVKYSAGYVYVADEAGTVIASSTQQSGRKQWVRKLNGAVTAEFHVDARGCFVPCDDQRLYAFRAIDGKKLWDRPFVCEGPLQDPVQVAENTAFQFARGDKFYAINLTTGKARWTKPDGRIVLAAFDGEVYLLNSRNTLMIIDEMPGTVKTSLPMTGWDVFAPNVSAPSVYVASRGGAVACIRKITAGRLSPEMLR